MIPNSPIWSLLNDVKSYPITNFVAPIKPSLISDISLGPILIGQSNDRINSRYWAVYQSGNDVVLVGSIGDSWGNDSILFQESKPITQIKLTFDQLGRAMVFFSTGGDLYLFWYDPISQMQTVQLISTGSSIEAGFDIINNTSDSDSDAMLFYTRSNVVYMRIQRERWGNEYPESIFLGDGVTPVTGLELVSSGMRVDNRFQVVYRYKLGNYTPPVAIKLSVVTLPTLQGAVIEGGTLTCDVGTYLGGPISYSYKWTRNDVDITSPTEGSIVCTVEEEGDTVYKLELTVSDGTDTLVYLFEKSSANDVPVGPIEGNYAYWRYISNDGVSKYSFENAILPSNWNDRIALKVQITAVDLEQDEIILVSQAITEGTGEYGSQLLIKVIGTEKREFVFILGGTKVSIYSNTALKIGVWEFAIAPNTNPAYPNDSHVVSMWHSMGAGEAGQGAAYVTPGSAVSSAYALMFGNTHTPVPNKGFKGVMHGFEVHIGGTTSSPTTKYIMPANDKNAVVGYNGTPVYDKDGNYLFLGRILPASTYSSSKWKPYAFNYVYQDTVATNIYEN